MTIQITVRLDDEAVEFVDEQVRQGRARSRAAVVNQALARERRRAIAARDAAILSAEATAPGAGGHDPDDLDDLNRHVASLPLGID
jgi:Arc/MetJ-type ribon-helix-helix transcriptional regulator